MALPTSRRCSPAQVRALAEEIRAFLVESVSRTGGHLGPNLGVVELTIALHRVFDTPRDTIVFDTGHQSYVHKLLTGRHDFSELRSRGGLSGYPSRAESEHDVVENSHASTSLSWADGIAKARRLRGERDRHTVAVIGDGALTGGMAWEAINNIAADKDLPLVIVVNDNERSYAPTIGGLADHLATLRTTRGYERFLDWGKNTLNRTPVVGGAMYETLHGMKKGIKDIVAPQGMFEDLGLKYLGPVDGHDEAALESALRRARASAARCSCTSSRRRGAATTRPATTRATSSTPSAVSTPRRACRSRSPGASGPTSSATRWSALGARARGRRRRSPRRCSSPWGSTAFADAYPDRVFDVGIAEQHAVTMAAGLAFGGTAPGRRRVRDVPQPCLRPAAHGLRAAPGRGHVRARPGRHHRQRRRRPTTACGTWR